MHTGTHSGKRKGVSRTGPPTFCVSLVRICRIGYVNELLSRLNNDSIYADHDETQVRSWGVHSRSNG